MHVEVIELIKKEIEDLQKITPDKIKIICENLVKRVPAEEIAKIIDSNVELVKEEIRKI